MSITVETAPVTEKLWGLEVECARVPDENYTAKLLMVNPGFTSSVHYHKEKHETFYVMRGNVILSMYTVSVLAGGYENAELDSETSLVSGQRVMIPPLTIHSFRATVPSIIVEGSTLHRDDDVYRYRKSRGFSCDYT